MAQCESKLKEFEGLLSVLDPLEASHAILSYKDVVKMLQQVNTWTSNFVSNEEIFK